MRNLYIGLLVMWWQLCGIKIILFKQLFLIEIMVGFIWIRNPFFQIARKSPVTSYLLLLITPLILTYCILLEPEHVAAFHKNSWLFPLYKPVYGLLIPLIRHSCYLKMILFLFVFIGFPLSPRPNPSAVTSPVDWSCPWVHLPHFSVILYWIPICCHLHIKRKSPGHEK